MAYAHSDVARLDRFGLKARIQEIRDMLEQRAARRAVYNRTVYELQALSNRDLADLGFHRSEIPQIARQAADQA
ncbi:DUF1127 domain-containing protein [Nioella nitratireducens]|uniref:DUF1127 domain-containing protein n=1 Tax=Nioella nitratireducens TaxID=1287720 RepID=UPI0008FD7752|nr:DUF1127 domain-containing protein [Nioella nitratireducens]